MSIASSANTDPDNKIGANVLTISAPNHRLNVTPAGAAAMIGFIFVIPPTTIC